MNTLKYPQRADRNPGQRSKGNKTDTCTDRKYMNG